jgi:hypothetical protein
LSTVALNLAGAVAGVEAGLELELGLGLELELELEPHAARAQAERTRAVAVSRRVVMGATLRRLP